MFSNSSTARPEEGLSLAKAHREGPSFETPLRLRSAAPQDGRVGFGGFAFALTALALAACTPVDRGFGEALRYDMALQTINPEPVYGPDALQPGYHGEKGQKATERYRKDQVNDRFRSGIEQKGLLSTTETISQGGGR